MKKNLLLLIVSILILKHAPGQVKLFEPNIITNNQSFGLTISPNGKELLFVNSFGGRDTLQIFHSKLINGKWQKPTLAVFSDTNFKQIDPAYSPDGKSILFNTLTSVENGFDIYITYKTKSGWTKPEKLSDSINTSSSDFYATITKEKHIYFTRRTKSNDLYVSRFVDNKYLNAVPLNKTINSEGNESNPFISPNDDYIIFFADYANGFGDTDLYISFNKQNKWSSPLNLGAEINSSISEFCPSINFYKGLFLFSRTEVVNGKRIDNIYSYPLKKLKISNLRKHAKWN